jgi:hypothetical protein
VSGIIIIIIIIIIKRHSPSARYVIAANDVQIWHFWEKHCLLWGYLLDTRKCLDWFYVVTLVLFPPFYCFLFFVFILSSCADSVTGSCNWWVSTLK